MIKEVHADIVMECRVTYYMYESRGVWGYAPTPQGNYEVLGEIMLHLRQLIVLFSTLPSFSSVMHSGLWDVCIKVNFVLFSPSIACLAQSNT